MNGTPLQEGEHARQKCRSPGIITLGQDGRMDVILSALSDLLTPEGGWRVQLLVRIVLSTVLLFAYVLLLARTFGARTFANFTAGIPLPLNERHAPSGGGARPTKVPESRHHHLG
ncbi:hypothetical protein CTI14_51100, partial [Methylobacterium radiotolerans]